MDMSALIFDGTALRDRFFIQARQTMAESGLTPGVALLAVDHDPMATTTFNMHTRVFEKLGFTVRPVLLPAPGDQDDLLKVVDELNADPAIDVIQALSPMPETVDMRRVIAAIDPAKEAEGLNLAHSMHLNPLSLEPARRPPIAPVAMVALLDEVGFSFSGSSVMILADSRVVSRTPLGRMILRNGILSVVPFDAIAHVVPLEHPRARDISRECDLVMVVAQEPHVFTGDWVKPGAVIVDVNNIAVLPRTPDERFRVVGGVDVESVAEVARVVAPIPGGFGPVLMGAFAARIAQVTVERHRALAVTA
jgi:methylenetetrahydrofolate dehydrogenase (NADP+)/methenyltetrahydrofolate cyclohydrolase